MSSANSKDPALETPAVDEPSGDSPISDKRADYVRPFVRHLDVGQTKFGSQSNGGDSTFSS